MSLDIATIAMVLAAAIMHATWNALVKSAADKWMLFISMTLFGAIASLALAVNVPFPDPESWKFLIISTVIHYAYYVSLLLSYGKGDLSKVYPIARGSAPLLVAIGGHFIVGETLSTMAYLAISLSSLGIMALAFEKGLPRGDDKKPIFFAVLTGILISTYTITDGMGVRASGNSLSYIFWLFALEGIPFLIWVLYKWRDYITFSKNNWRFILGGSMAAHLAYGLVIAALGMGALASVSALRETSVIIAAIIGTFILKETFGMKRIIAASMVGCGVILLNFYG